MKFLHLLLLVTALGTVHSEDTNTGLNVVTHIGNFFRGFMSQVFAEMQLPQAALCMDEIPQHFLVIVNQISNFTNGNTDFGVMPILRLVKDVVFITVEAYEDCKNVTQAYYKIKAYFNEITDYQSSYWEQFLKNALAEGVALFGQISYIVKVVGRGEWALAGGEIGDILYDLVFLKMEDIIPADI